MSSDEKPTISIYACILPRLEAFYLEEWVVHHLGLGVTHFHLCLYDTDYRAHKGNLLPVAGSDKPFLTWGKKPHADYFADFTDAEVMGKLKEVSDNYPVTFTKVSELPDMSRIVSSKSSQYRNLV